MGTEGCRGAHALSGRGAYLIMMRPLGCFMGVSMDHRCNRVKPGPILCVDGPEPPGLLVPINDPKVLFGVGPEPLGLWPNRMDCSAL